MRRSFGLICALAILPFFTLPAQTNTVVSAGYTPPVPLYAAPGQVVTLFVEGVGKSLTQPVRAPDGSWPNSLAGISVTLLQGTKIIVPILEIRPIPTCSPPFGFEIPCGQITAITVQIPYGLIPLARCACGPWDRRHN
jgi:hypothetical protein